MRKWKIEINAINQHVAIHMLTDLMEQFIKAENSGKTVGHILAKGNYGYMSVDAEGNGVITFTEQMFIDYGFRPEFYKLAINDILHCENISVYDQVMEHCLKANIKAYGDREKCTVKFKQNEEIKIGTN